MRDQTLAPHAGFDANPPTKMIRVPINRTVAYQRVSTQHGEALANQKESGRRCSSIANLAMAQRGLSTVTQ